MSTTVLEIAIRSPGCGSRGPDHGIPRGRRPLGQNSPLRVPAPPTLWTFSVPSSVPKLTDLQQGKNRTLLRDSEWGELGGPWGTRHVVRAAGLTVALAIAIVPDPQDLPTFEDRSRAARSRNADPLSSLDWLSFLIEIGDNCIDDLKLQLSFFGALTLVVFEHVRDIDCHVNFLVQFIRDLMPHLAFLVPVSVD
jgi:hypothetical protein